MNGLVSAMLSEDTLTNNGAVTHSTSSNFNVDLFFLAGACRNVKEEEIHTLLSKSYGQDPIKTLKIIFWAGDIRGGAGERRFFTVALNWLLANHKEDLYKYLSYVPEFSRWDVLFQLDDDKVLDYICQEVKNGNSLLCKWLPRKVTTTDRRKREHKKGKTVTTTIVKTKRTVKNAFASKVRHRLGWTPKQYRKWLVEHSNVVETKMCAKLWKEIEYSQVPSVAMNKYNKAWVRNDADRFNNYLESVKKGETKINAGAIFPHDIISSAIGNCYINPSLIKDANIVQWENLPNYMVDGSIIPVCDLSGSMTWENNALAMKISVALGIYISERNQGPFKDAFITFSEKPCMHLLSGNLRDRMTQMRNADMGYNTNLCKVFDLILSKAQAYHISESEMPKTVLIISDMEFDEATEGKTNFQSIKAKYQTAGYNCPNLVFWNVNGRVGNVPVKYADNGTALVSGASPSILKSILGNEINPVSMMDKVIETERYSFINAD